MFSSLIFFVQKIFNSLFLWKQIFIESENLFAPKNIRNIEINYPNNWLKLLIQ